MEALFSTAGWNMQAAGSNLESNVLRTALSIPRVVDGSICAGCRGTRRISRCLTDRVDAHVGGSAGVGGQRVMPRCFAIFAWFGVCVLRIDGGV